MVDNAIGILKEVIDLAKNIKTFKSSGMNNISSRLVKDTILAIPEQITYLFNASINTCIFPDSWKMDRVTPIPKNGDVTNLNNIKPIALMPIIGKLMEKYINDKVVEFLETNEYLYKHQGGFRKNKSTIKTIHKLANDIAMANNRDEHTIAVFLDVSKAFDTINHDLLLDKMNKIGIRGGYLKWFRNYLEGRKQVTVNNWMTSDVCDGVSRVRGTRFSPWPDNVSNLC